ncbi:AMP-binding protein [Nocardiopsis composta]
MTSADSAHESTGPVPVHRMFERRAALDGGAPALVSAAGETSYRELDRRADGVAARLLRSGIGPGDLVGVRVRRGPGMIAAMLGVLKAGAAYVPVDPGDPEERSRHVIAESGMKALVSDGPAGSPGAEGPLLLDADGGQDADGQGPAARSPTTSTPPPTPCSPRAPPGPPKGRP